MDGDAVRDRLDGLIESTWGLAVLAACVEGGLLAPLATPSRIEEAAEAADVPAELAGRMLDVLVALGFVRRVGGRYISVDGLQPMMAGNGAAPLASELRVTLQQSRDLVQRAGRHELMPGWVHTDADLLSAQGDSGRSAARALAEHGVLRLADVVQRLNTPIGGFLDVGAGVGVIAIEMCRVYPALRVVGLEPAEAPRRLAMARVAAAGLTDRIEIRAQAVEDLTDLEQFDLAYMPQVFLPDDSFRRGLATVRDALRPGGWVTLPVISVAGDDLRSALLRLRNTLWGGGARLADEVAEAVTGAGFVDVEVRAVGGTRHSVVGRRPE